MFDIKKKGAFALLFFCFVALSSATLGEYPVDSCVNIKTILNTSTVNISSISDPDSLVVVSNQAMEKNARTFNYTFCNTTKQGTYIYDYFDEEGNTYVNDFIINPRGQSIDTGRALVYMMLLITNALFIVGLGFASMKVPYRNLEDVENNEIYITKVTKSKYVKLLCIWMLYAACMWFLSIISSLTNNYIYFEGLRNLMTNLFTFSYSIFGGFTVFMVFFIMIIGWKDILIGKQIKRFGRAFVSGKY